MTSSPAVIFEEDLSIPAGVSDLDCFRWWTREESFPERGRIDYLAGTVEVNLSPEDLYTHGVSRRRSPRGCVPSSSTVGRAACSRTAPASSRRRQGCRSSRDVVAVLWDSLRQGRIREVPAAQAKEDRFVKLEGIPDLIVEIVSDSSTRKDRVRLPRLYAAAGAPELWLADCRGADLIFEVHALSPAGYQQETPDPEGWLHSPRLGRRVRLGR